MTEARPGVRHPIVWTVLYLPFGAMAGFVSVALVYIASRNGISITDTAFLAASQMVSQWLKWLWAPAVDVTLTPKRWYLIGVVTSAAGVFVMSVAPMTKDTVGTLVIVVTIASLMRSFVGMAIEAMVAGVTPASERGRTGAWFQIGNLGGAGLGGGLGLLLLERLASPWMAGAILAATFLTCALALYAVPPVAPHRRPGGARAAMRGVLGDIKGLARTKSGLLLTLLCFLPFGTTAAGGLLNEAQIADHWHATSDQVALVGGFLSSGVVAVGCLAGGWIATRMPPRRAYTLLVLANAAVPLVMAACPAEAWVYVTFNLLYGFAVGMVFAGWTAAVLDTMGTTSAATKYTLFASLSNFPAWWMLIVLGHVAARYGANTMLVAESVIAIVAVAGFLVFARIIGRSRRPEAVADAA